MAKYESDKLYLDLLKKVLTNTLYRQEPNSDGTGIAYVKKFAQHYIESNAISLLPMARFDNLYACIKSVHEDKVDGDLIDTGVWRGGSVIFMRAVLETLNDDRNVWVADSFEGLPIPDKDKYPLEHDAHNNFISRFYDRFEASIEEVQQNFKNLDLFDDRVKWLKGWFKDTLPNAPIKKLAILRLDGDYYESTIIALESLYPKLSTGGYVIVDDYGEDSWTYCRQAVDEYRAANGINEPLIKVDSKCYLWKKLTSQ